MKYGDLIYPLSWPKGACMMCGRPILNGVLDCRDANDECVVAARGLEGLRRTFRPDDIVTRLRNDDWVSTPAGAQLAREAADEIERLRKALASAGRRLRQIF